MNAHNYFVIKNGRQKTLATNTALSLGMALKNNTAFARYIAFGSGGGVDTLGKLKNIVKVLPVRLTDINPNATQGILHAEYSAQFADIDSGITFTELTLCSNLDGSGAVNYAVVQPITIGLEPCEVSVTVFVFVSGDVKLCGGDNPIARFLLGASRLEGIFEMACGKCTYPNQPINRGVDSIVKRVSVSPIFSENGIAFESNQLTLKVEFLVLCNGVPALRILPDYTSSASMGSCNVNISLSAGIMPHFSYDVTNVKLNNQPLSSYKIMRSISGSTRLGDILPFNVGRVSRLVTDDKMQYVACVTANDVILLQGDSGGFKIIMRLAYNNEFVEVLSDGAVALWGKTLKIYKTATNAPYVASEFDLPCGEQNAIVKDGDYYHAATLAGGDIVRYKILDSCQEIARIKAGAAQILRRDGEFIMYCGRGCVTGVVSIAQRKIIAEENISELYALYPNAEITVSDGLAWLKTSAETRFAHLDSASQVCYPLNSSCALGNEIFACYAQGGNSIGYLDRWQGKLIDAVCLVGSKKIVGICKTKYFILALFEDGKLEGIYLDSSDIYLSSNDFTAGSAVSYIARQKVVPPQNEVANVRMEIVI